MSSNDLEKLAECIALLSIVQNSYELSTALRSIVYQTNSILHEVAQKAGGGFWSTSYIEEKGQTILRLSKEVK